MLNMKVLDYRGGKSCDFFSTTGNIIKIRDSDCSYCPSVEFTFKDGKIINFYYLLSIINLKKL